MDKDIMNYLDKVGQYLQGAGEKGFEVYVHGTYVSLLMFTILGLTIIAISIFLIWKSSKRVEDYDLCGLIIGISSLMILTGCLLIAFNIVGVFAPDYVAIKDIAENIGGK
ncbi:hypothetical protein SD311_005130 [Staphylococcus sp. KG4-3]|uniref:hypothetical protein n=1 Tax=Staphylococcus sp. KG4-3 TaxID=3093634 RepID=UPI00298F1285|nr:hypothetical protein [Staphylococcus sp. KG4-3]MDW8544410.1 hypothetical protein [Staphylococcus sp. KG4-1]MDW8560832.1 hypothetical protein [Staphylococcus sp. KG4-3]